MVGPNILLCAKRIQSLPRRDDYMVVWYTLVTSRRNIPKLGGVSKLNRSEVNGLLLAKRKMITANTSSVTN